MWIRSGFRRLLRLSLLERNHRSAAAVDHFAHSERQERRDGDFTQRSSEDYAGACQRRKRACAMHVQETILERLGKALNVRLEDVMHEPLPQSWVDLIQHLNEQERRQSERQPEPKPRRR